MQALIAKARELTEAIRKKQDMLQKFWPRVAIQTQEELILILSAQLVMLLDEMPVIENIHSQTQAHKNDNDQNLS